MDMTDAGQCAAIACHSEIGQRYGFIREKLAERLGSALADADTLLLVAETCDPEPRLAGFAWIRKKGCFGAAPYLKLIAVDAGLRGSGTGTVLMDEFERRSADCGRMHTLLVSDFNDQAQAFYRARGYLEAGRLPDFAVDGVTEILMYKPVLQFRSE